MTKGELIKKLQKLSVSEETKIVIPSFWIEGEFVSLDNVSIDYRSNGENEIVLSDFC